MFHLLLTTHYSLLTTYDLLLLELTSVSRVSIRCSDEQNGPKDVDHAPEPTKALRHGICTRRLGWFQGWGEEVYGESLAVQMAVITG